MPDIALSPLTYIRVVLIRTIVCPVLLYLSVVHPFLPSIIYWYITSWPLYRIAN